MLSRRCGDARRRSRRRPSGTTRAAAERSAEIADNWFYVLASVDLARAVCDQDRPAECLRDSRRERAASLAARLSRSSSSAGQPPALSRSHGSGSSRTPRAIAREAVGHAEGTEFLGFHADALLVLAEVLRLAGEPAEAAAALEEAVALYERKGNVVSAAKARAALDELG